MTERRPLLKNLNWKFGAMAAMIVVIVSLAAQSLIMKEARAALEGRLGEKAAFINSYYSLLISDYLQRQDDVSLQQVLNRLEQDPEIISVVVVDDQSQIRYHADAEKLGTPSDDPLIAKALQTNDGIMNPFTNSGGRALALVAPLKIQSSPHPIGAVRIDFTYRHIDEQLQRFDTRFHMAVFGFIATAIGFMIAGVRRWVGAPLETTEKAISAMHLATAEPNLPETADELGRLNKTVNDMLIRFQTEQQEQGSAGALSPAEQEKDFIDRVMRSVFPNARIILADKENKIISNRGDGLAIEAATGHLLDLITDVNFATLVGAAFQKEGEMVHGPVQMQNRPCAAAVLCMPQGQAKAVKTIIAVEAQNGKGESSL